MNHAWLKFTWSQSEHRAYSHHEPLRVNVRKVCKREGKPNTDSCKTLNVKYSNVNEGKVIRNWSMVNVASWLYIHNMFNVIKQTKSWINWFSTMSDERDVCQHHAVYTTDTRLNLRQHLHSTQPLYREITTETQRNTFRMNTMCFYFCKRNWDFTQMCFWPEFKV